MSSQHVKILFELVQDEDGYPPVGVEGMWGAPLANGNALLDNIPFYARGVSSGDEVRTRTDSDGRV